MTSALQQIHYKSTNLKFLKHDVVSVAALPEPLLEQLVLSRLPPGLGSKLADKAKDSTFTVIRHCSTEKGQSTLLSTAGAPYFVENLAFWKMHLYLSF